MPDQPAEADGVRRSAPAIAGLAGSIYASVQTRRLPGDFDVGAADHDLRDRHPRRRRQPRRRRRRGADRQRRARAPARPRQRPLGLLRRRSLVALFAHAAAVAGGSLACSAARSPSASSCTASPDASGRRGTAGQPCRRRRARATRSDTWMLLPDRSDADRELRLRRARSRPSSCLTRLKGTLAHGRCSCPTLYLAAFVWENLLIAEDRRRDALILLGALLVVLMNARPQGLFGTAAGGDRVSERRARRCSSCRGVTKSFGGLQVISGLDLHVDEGEIVSVIGPNGAGKTTLFNLITGVYTPGQRRDPASTASRSSASRRTRSRTSASRARSRRCGCS